MDERWELIDPNYILPGVGQVERLPDRPRWSARAGGRDLGHYDTVADAMAAVEEVGRELGLVS